jgi:hypothetical protein
VQKEVFVQLSPVGQRLIAHVAVVPNAVMDEFDMMA